MSDEPTKPLEPFPINAEHMRQIETLDTLQQRVRAVMSPVYATPGPERTAIEEEIAAGLRSMRATIRKANRDAKKNPDQ